MIEAGYAVSEAETGDEAAALLASEAAFDLLVTDIQMPGETDGIALANLIRSQHPGTPVVYMTGRPEVMRRAGRLGAREVLIRKPHGPAEVLSTVERLLMPEVSRGASPPPAGA